MIMRLISSLCILLMICAISKSLLAQDSIDRFLLESKQRAAYWKARGFQFDPMTTSADSMDRQVQTYKRAEYWKKRGFKFDYRKMSAQAMDRQAESIMRAEYWKRWGIVFDAKVMDAKTMDEAAIHLQKVQQKIRELEEKNGSVPTVLMDQSAADALLPTPQIEGTTKLADRNQQAPAGFNNIPFNFGGGLSGAGNSAPQRGGRGGGPSSSGSSISIPGVGAGGGRSAIPPGVDPEDFVDFLNRSGG